MYQDPALSIEDDDVIDRFIDGIDNDLGAQLTFILIFKEKRQITMIDFCLFENWKKIIVLKRKN